MQAPVISDQAVLFISCGFQGPHIMQVIVWKKEHDVINLCLTDGSCYIGATFQGNVQGLKPYSIVRIKASFISRSQPIIISELEILFECSSLQGKSPIILSQYFSFLKRHRERDFPEQSKPIKKVKFLNQFKASPQQLQLRNFQSQSPQSQSLTQNKQKSLIKKQIKNKQIKNKSIKIKKFPEQFETETYETSGQNEFHCKHEQKPKGAYIVNQEEQIKKISNYGKITNLQFCIKELEEKLQHWKLECRVNYIRSFISSRGRPCTLMYLIDRNGDSIRAMHYGNVIPKLGKTYEFSQGQVVRSRYQSLELVFNWRSIFIQKNTVNIYPFCVRKLVSFNELEMCVGQISSIMGIVRNSCIEGEGGIESRRVVNAILWDPSCQCSIQFSYNFIEGERIPENGEICVLNNFNITQQSARKLKGNKSSYLVLVQHGTQLKDNSQSPQLRKLKQFQSSRIQQQQRVIEKYEDLSQIQAEGSIKCEHKIMLGKQKRSLNDKINL